MVIRGRMDGCPSNCVVMGFQLNSNMQSERFVGNYFTYLRNNHRHERRALDGGRMFIILRGGLEKMGRVRSTETNSSEAN